MLSFEFLVPDCGELRSGIRKHEYPVEADLVCEAWQSEY